MFGTGIDRLSAVAIAFTLGLTAAACSSVEPPEDLPPQEYRQRFLQTDPTEPYHHSASNVLFPVTAGAFHRTGVSAYGPGTVDASGHYANELLGAMATVYFYPGTANPEFTNEEVYGHYEEFKRTIERTHPGAELLEEGSGTFSVNNTPATGLYAVYHLYGIGDAKEEMESHFFLFPFGSWYLKFRITYPFRVRAEGAREVQPFLDAIWWEKSAT